MNLNYFDTVLPDATTEEIRFWEQAYLTMSRREDMLSGHVKSYATQAVLNRREVFPHTSPFPRTYKKDENGAP